MKLNSFAKFAWLVLALNLGVILWGAFVRATGSGAGCGAHWPLCNGEVVPLAPQIATVIEFAHRLTSGAALLTVIGLVIWAWRAFPSGHRVRFGAIAILIGMIAESLAGASLVLFRWVAMDISIGRIIVVPIHLTITFYLLASLALTAWWASGGVPLRLRGQGSIAWLLSLALIGVVVMSMAGAITALGDTVLPVPTLTPESIRELSPLGQFLVNLRIAHPLIAIGVGAYILFLVTQIYNNETNRTVIRLALWLGALIAIQLAAGALNIFFKAPVWMQILHLLLADLVWLVLILLTATRLAENHATQKIKPLTELAMEK
jgi:heme A synthase